MACWLLNEMGGTTIKDHGPYQKDLTLTSGTPNTDWQGGLFGDCLLFNGTSEYAQSTFPNLAVPHTLHSIFRFSITASYQSVFSYADPAVGSPNGNSGWRFGMNGSNSKLSLTFGGVADYDFSLTLTNNKWYNVIVTMPGNSSTCTAYVMDEDGVRTITTLTTGTMTGTLSRATLGSRGSNDSNWMNGRINYARLWNRILSQDEAALLHHNPFTGVEDGEDDWFLKHTGGASATTIFRKTLSGIGTRSGSRQVHGW